MKRNLFYFILGALLATTLSVIALETDLETPENPPTLVKCEVDKVEFVNDSTGWKVFVYGNKQDSTGTSNTDYNWSVNETAANYSTPTMRTEIKTQTTLLLRAKGIIGPNDTLEW